MKKISFNEGKVLRLNNVLSCCLEADQDQYVEFEKHVERMKAYINVKGGNHIGPIIQYMRPIVNENGDISVKVELMLQSDKYIHSIDAPFSMKSVLRVTNCMYCRYCGPEKQVNLAYSKINLEAFEKDICLKGDSYTIFVDRNDDEDYIVTDVFYGV